jgi:predicted extracellular nuclease
VKAARFRLGACAVIALVAVVAGGVPQAGAAGGNIVISQVYGGGGNAGASHTHDFVELYNPGDAAVLLTGRSIQYASATGAGQFGSSTAQITELDGTIQPHGYFLVQEATNNAAVGAPLPAADQVDATPIFMAGTAGKVVLATGTTPLGCNGGSTPCNAAALARITDLVGYGNADFFEGSGAAPTLSSTTSAQRGNGGCNDTDNNAADFVAAGTAPRNSTNSHFCDADQAPSVSSTSPASGQSSVARNANITINFSEPVAVQDGWYSILCNSTGAHPATVSGGDASYTLDPTSDFGFNETCSVTIDDAGVSDVDANDPPDNMAADHVFSFTTEPELELTQIAQVQGASHMSTYTGQLVQVEGVVIAKTDSNVWVQDATPDADPATSEAILVFGSTVANAVVVGDHVRVRGTVTEFRPGCFGCGPTSSAFDNLTITELASPGLGVTKLGTAALPAATVIGMGGRTRPTEVIENDSDTGNVETDNDFDPTQDGIDFYETLESMLVKVNNAVVVGPTNSNREIFVLADNGAGASVRTVRGGINVRDLNSDALGDYRSGDLNPERIQLDDTLLSGSTPTANVGDHFETSAVGILDYNFANFEVNLTAPLTRLDGSLGREVTSAPRENELSVATFNVENLDPSDEAAIPRLARIVVENMLSPDLIGIEEMQDNNGAIDDGTTAADRSWQAFIDAIVVAGGPRYDYRQIDPVNNADGGEPGGNIRVGFLFRTDRGLSFVDRPGGNATTPTSVFRAEGRAHLTLSPGRVDPLNPAWTATRKPLAGEFRWNDKTLIVIVNHFSSKGGDDPLFGRFQPPVRSSEVRRHQQAESVNSFVDSILAAERKANVIVLGDINDFEFSQTTRTLTEGGVLTSLMETLPLPERYSYVFEGNSQVLDQILFSANMMRDLTAYDVVHVNAEFADQASDHDPSVARTKVLGGGGG